MTLAAIYEKSNQINSAGGYLRSLTERAKNGKFIVGPMIMALPRAKLDGSKAPPTPSAAGTSRDEAPKRWRQSGGFQPSADLE